MHCFACVPLLVQSKLIGRLLSPRTPNVYVFCKLLLPDKNIDKRIYSMKDTQLLKIFSRLLMPSATAAGGGGGGAPTAAALLRAYQEGPFAGEISEVVREAFAASARYAGGARASTLSVVEVDGFLDRFAAVGREEEQV